MTPYPHRDDGYKLLNGHGLEIGAFHQPAPLPAHCTVEYCDVCSPEEIIKHFPELNLNAKALVKVDHLCDLDKQGLSLFSAEQFDFVILNHVIEHVANPIKIIGELFRITRPGGHIVISAPDKRFTFDHARPLTSFEHLLKEYQNNVTEVSEEHYLDFLRGVHPETSQLSPAEFQGALNGVKQRREHVHVWHSKSFTEFMQKSLELLNIKADCVFLNRGAKNHFEYFSVWRKTTDKPSNLDKPNFLKTWWRRIRRRH